MIFEGMDKNCGASGCGCSASVLNGYFFKKMLDGEINRIFVRRHRRAAFADQCAAGESIPGIAHAVHIERRKI